MTVITAFKSAASNVLDLVFPILCVECGQEGAYLCGKCRRLLKRNEFQICAGCGHKTLFGRTHSQCQPASALDGLLTVTPYKEKLSRRLVELMKYHYISDIAPILGSLLAEEVANLELADYFRDFVLVPLPLHRTREKWRGYNQALLMAQETGRTLGQPVQPELLVRVRKTKVQAELKDQDRPLNVAGAFLAASSVPIRVIIIDDVSTTRSTLQQAAAALKHSGAQEVWGLAFAQG